MTHKERILAILNRQPVDRLPVDLWHTPEIAAALRAHCGVQDDFAMWESLGIDKIVWVFLDYRMEAGERAGAQSGAGAEDVRQETRHCLETLGAGREGFICCSCHNVQPGTPIENVLAMIETAQDC